MKNVFIANAEIIEDISLLEISASFKDSLVVYSSKKKLKSFDELKDVVNSYKSIWENIINTGSESCLDDYSNIIDNLERLGTVISSSKEIGVTRHMKKPAKNLSEISVFIENFNGKVILWNDDITGDLHILGLGDETNFFTINNYL
jgi:hypothetical protein